MPKRNDLPPLKTFYNDDKTIEIGIDESGRGALISRVYAAAVVWNPKVKSPLIKDSKKFKNHEDRLVAYEFVKENCLTYGVGYAEPEEIDELNILQATIVAMHRAIDNCHVKPQHILVDGTQFKIYEVDDDIVNFTTVIDGDNKYYSIAAASILAKVERDLYIQQLCEEDASLNLYDLQSNKGYGSKKHLEAIEHWGITKHHRESFRVCKKFASKREQSK